MRKGKMVAQGSHASCSFLSKKIMSGEKLSPVEEHWLKNSFRKICLGVDSEEELVRIHSVATAAGLECHLITDNGATEFNGVPTKTCLAIGPDLDERIDPITQHLKLL